MLGVSSSSPDVVWRGCVVWKVQNYKCDERCKLGLTLYHINMRIDISKCMRMFPVVCFEKYDRLPSRGGVYSTVTSLFGGVKVDLEVKSENVLLTLSPLTIGPPTLTGEMRRRLFSSCGRGLAGAEF